VRPRPLERIRDYAKVIGMEDLYRHNVFASGVGSSWILEWLNSECQVVSEMAMTLSEDAEGLIAEFKYYLVNTQTGKLYSPHDQTTPFPNTEPIRYSAQVVRCRHGLAGARHFFVCRTDERGIPCRRHVQKLFIPCDDYTLGCSKCHALSYLCRMSRRVKVAPPRRTLRIRKLPHDEEDQWFPSMHKPHFNEAILTHGLRMRPRIVLCSGIPTGACVPPGLARPSASGRKDC